MTKYFVWVKGLKGPVPQIWHSKPVDGGGKVKPYIFLRELQPYEENLSLDVLAEFYVDNAKEIET